MMPAPQAEVVHPHRGVLAESSERAELAERVELAERANPGNARLDADELGRIAGIMQGQKGVRLADRRYRLRRYEHCFVGREAVDWLVSTFDLSRSQALRLGERLHAHRLIRHVLEEHDFADDHLYYQFATSVPSQRPGDEQAARLTDAQLREIARNMRDRDGLRVGARYHRLVRYPNCFEGRELVDWLVQHRGIGRDEAQAIGRRLLRRDLIRHVFDEHDFEDRRLFYRFT